MRAAAAAVVVEEAQKRYDKKAELIRQAQAKVAELEALKEKVKIDAEAAAIAAVDGSIGDEDENKAPMRDEKAQAIFP